LDAPDYSNAVFNEVFLQELSHSITPRGVGLEGCPYSKNANKKRLGATTIRTAFYSYFSF
jgi:hypothetical protein